MRATCDGVTPQATIEPVYALCVYNTRLALKYQLERSAIWHMMMLEVPQDHFQFLRHVPCLLLLPTHGSLNLSYIRPRYLYSGLVQLRVFHAHSLEALVPIQ